MYKHLFTAVIIVFVLAAACSRKSVPVISERTRSAPEETPVTINLKPDTASGRILFMNRCSRCHDLPQPAQYTVQRWEGILSYMIPRARLSEEQGLHVKAYLRSQALK